MTNAGSNLAAQVEDQPVEQKRRETQGERIQRQGQKQQQGPQNDQQDRKDQRDAAGHGYPPVRHAWCRSRKPGSTRGRQEHGQDDHDPDQHIAPHECPRKPSRQTLPLDTGRTRSPPAAIQPGVRSGVGRLTQPLHGPGAHQFHHLEDAGAAALSGQGHPAEGWISSPALTPSFSARPRITISSNSPTPHGLVPPDPDPRLRSHRPARSSRTSDALSVATCSFQASSSTKCSSLKKKPICSGRVFRLLKRLPRVAEDPHQIALGVGGAVDQPRRIQRPAVLVDDGRASVRRSSATGA